MDLIISLDILCDCSCANGTCTSSYNTCSTIILLVAVFISISFTKCILLSGSFNNSVIDSYKPTITFRRFGGLEGLFLVMDLEREVEETLLYDICDLGLGNTISHGNCILSILRTYQVEDSFRLSLVFGSFGI